MDTLNELRCHAETMKVRLFEAIFSYGVYEKCTQETVSAAVQLALLAYEDLTRRDESDPTASALPYSLLDAADWLNRHIRWYEQRLKDFPDSPQLLTDLQAARAALRALYLGTSSDEAAPTSGNDEPEKGN